jgi:hypothetical protein
MKKVRPILSDWITPALFAGIIALVFSASCSLGLEPAQGNAGAATVTLSLATLPGYGARIGRTDSEGRAVVQGGGYLYIRALGGPGGTGAKRYYGPYPIRTTASGYDLFKTTDIPGGSYDGLAVLFSATPIDSVPVYLSAGDTTLGAVFSLPDADFLQAVTAPLPDSPESLTALDVALNDSASFAITGATAIRPNSTTNISVTLVPATSKVLFATEGGGVGYDRSEPHRAFIRVTRLKDLFGPMIPGASSLGITVRSPQTVTIAAFAAYRANGSLIAGSVATDVVLTSDQTARKTAVWDGSDECYLYVEFTGMALNFAFDAFVPGAASASVSILDEAIVSDREASIYVLPRALRASDFSPVIDPDTVCGSICLASCQTMTTGNTVSGTLIAKGSNAPWVPAAPVTGYVYAVVDGTLWLGNGATETSLTPLGQGTFSSGSAQEFTAATPKRYEGILFNVISGGYVCDPQGSYDYDSTFGAPETNEIYLFSTSVDWTGVWNLADPKTHPGCVGYGTATSAGEWNGWILKSHSGAVYALVSGRYAVNNIVRYRSSLTWTPPAEVYIDMNEELWIPLMYYIHATNVNMDAHYTVTISHIDFDDFCVGAATVTGGEGLFPLIDNGGTSPYPFIAGDNYGYDFIDDANLYPASGSFILGSMSTAFIELNLGS